MYRFWAGLVIATGCHLLLFGVPLYQQPEEPPQLLQTNAISVRFNSLKPMLPQQEAEVIPPPEPIKPPDKKVEKSHPQKPKPAPPKPKPKPRKVKIKKKAKVQPPKPTPLQKPRIVQEKSVAELQPQPAQEPATVTQPPKAELPLTPQKSVSRTPIVKKAPPILRKAYPKNEGNPPPKYPMLARRRGWEGTVQLSVLVLEDGRVGDISVLTSSGHPLLDDTALKNSCQISFCTRSARQ